jgi:hypothetical protein
MEIALWLDRSASIFWLGFLGKKAWRGRYVGGGGRVRAEDADIY